jgi:hypothetical protein
MPGRNRGKPNEEHHQRKLDARGCGLSTRDRGGGSEKPAHLPQEPRLPDSRPLAAGDAEEGDVAAEHPTRRHRRRDELRHAEAEGRVERGLHRQRAAPLRRALVVRRRLVLHGCRSRARVCGRPDRHRQPTRHVSLSGGVDVLHVRLRHRLPSISWMRTRGERMSEKKNQSSMGS